MHPPFVIETQITSFYITYPLAIYLYIIAFHVFVFKILYQKVIDAPAFQHCIVLHLCIYFHHNSFIFLYGFGCSLSSFDFNLKDSLQHFFLFPDSLLTLQCSGSDHIHPQWAQQCLPWLLLSPQFLQSSCLLSQQHLAHISLGCSSRGLYYLPL